MLPYLATVILLVSSLLLVAHVRLVRPAVKRREAPVAVPAVAEPDRRVPRDTDRPYPRPKGGRRKADRTCPVCGTGDETTPLDGKVLGWRAHGSCAEWLGEWRPPRPVPPPYGPDKSLIGYMEKGQKPTDPGPIEVGGGSVSVSGNLTGIASTGDGAANVIYTGGTVATVIAWGGGAGGSSSSLDNSEARACRDAIEQRRKPPGKPVITEFCTCGTKFTGTPEWIRMRLDVHRASGACPHSVKGRAADLRDLEGR